VLNAAIGAVVGQLKGARPYIRLHVLLHDVRIPEHPADSDWPDVNVLTEQLREERRVSDEHLVEAVPGTKNCPSSQKIARTVGRGKWCLQCSGPPQAAQCWYRISPSITRKAGEFEIGNTPVTNWLISTYLSSRFSQRIAWKCSSPRLCPLARTTEALINSQGIPGKRQKAFQVVRHERVDPSRAMTGHDEHSDDRPAHEGRAGVIR
jgi:hypothetical protein